MVKVNEYYSYNQGELPKGCQYCVKGEKVVIFVTGLCPRKCYFCPVSDQKYGHDVQFANEREIKEIEDVIAENDSNIQSIDKLIDEGYALVMWDRMEVHTKARLTAQGWYEVLDDEAKTYLVDNPRKNKKDKQLNQEASPPIIDSPTQTSLIGRFDSFSRSMNDFAKQYTPVGKLEKTFVYDIGKRIYDGMQWYIFGRDMEQIEREQTQKKAQAESQEKNK